MRTYTSVTFSAAKITGPFWSERLDCVLSRTIPSQHQKLVEYNMLDSLKLPKYEALILYSTDDTQARDATKHLYENGYQGALTLKGGLDTWRAAGMGLVKPRQP